MTNKPLPGTPKRKRYSKRREIEKQTRTGDNTLTHHPFNRMLHILDVYITQKKREKHENVEESEEERRRRAQKGNPSSTFRLPENEKRR